MVEAREDLALLLAKSDRLEEAEGRLREALRLSPGSARARALLGEVLKASNSSR